MPDDGGGQFQLAPRCLAATTWPAFTMKMRCVLLPDHVGVEHKAVSMSLADGGDDFTRWPNLPLPLLLP